MQIYVSKNESQWGPYEVSQMEGLIESGSFDLQDWAWVEGQTEWMPLARVQQMLLAEEAAKAKAIHQRVEQTKGQWRSKMTTPLSSYRNAYSPIRTSSPADCSSPVRGKRAGGSWARACSALAVVLLFIGGWVYWSDSAADYNLLIIEDGVAYQADAEEPFEGKAALRHENGQVVYEAEYEKGLQHGKFVSFYPDGAKESEGSMNEGNLHGNVVYYHPNGQKKSRYDYENGKATGRKNWDEKGKETNRAP